MHYIMQTNNLFKKRIKHSKKLNKRIKNPLKLHYFNNYNKNVLKNTYINKLLCLFFYNMMIKLQ